MSTDASDDDLSRSWTKTTGHSSSLKNMLGKMAVRSRKEEPLVEIIQSVDVELSPEEKKCLKEIQTQFVKCIFVATMLQNFDYCNHHCY